MNDFDTSLIQGDKGDKGPAGIKGDRVSIVIM